MTHFNTATSNIRAVVFATLLCLAPLAGSPAYAQADSPIPAVPAEGSVTTEQIESAIAAVESRDGLADDTRAEIIRQLRDAQAQLQNRASHEAAAEAFTASLASAPAKLEELKAELEQPPPAAPTLDSLGITDKTSLGDLEQQLARERAELANAETTLADLESSIATELERPAQARKRIEELRGSRAQLEQAATAEAGPGENAILADARKLAAALRLDARSAELNRLEQELLSNSVRLDLLRAERDMAARDTVLERRTSALLQEAVNTARQDDAARLLQESAFAQMAAANKHPVVRQLATETVEIGARLPGVVGEIDRISRELEQVEEQTRQIENTLNVSRQRLDVGGVSQAIGRLFAEERRNLPQVAQYRQQVRERRRTLSEIGLAQVRIEEERRALTPLDARIEELLAIVEEDVSDEIELELIRSDIQQLLNARRDALRQMATIYTTYLRALSDLDVAQRRLLDVATEYKDFLDQHLIWIPSASVVGTQTLTDLGSAVAWILSPESWGDTIRDSAISATEAPLRTALAALLIGLALLARRMLIKRNRRINELVGHLSTDHIGLTLQALGIACVVALPAPLALYTTGWLLQRASESTEFTMAVAAGLLAVGPFLYNVRLIRILSGTQGVMHTHFDWGERMLKTLRRQLDLLIAVAAPLAFVAVIAYQAPAPAIRDSLSRLAFVGLMAVLSMVFYAITNPSSGVATGYYSTHPRHWISRLKWLWHILAAGTPVLLAVLSLIGFTYTAAILTGQVVDTIWLIFAIIVLNLVVLRWLSLTRRKIALERALEERARQTEQKKDAGEHPEHTDTEGEAAAAAASKPIDLDVVDQQTRRLLQSGLFVLGVLGAWGIWSDVLPALGILEDITLWTDSTTVDGQQVTQPITLADLLLGLVILAVTWIASKNLPGLMEIAILQHLDLQPGGRYTINTLVRYVVVTVGLITVLNVIGWSWSRIQWLVAALSVGLGFGLQEIVANFVSGLIILFERPVRVGDTVTVGELTGSVTKVRIRATTITDWDRKEIIVPNKAFITDQVINWTLSDPITRIVIDVGISYGSDVKLAHDVMEEALRQQPLILDEPPPKAYFTGFGDSSLNFRLYVYSRQLADRLPIMHVVHEDILHALREHGIEIPFPQRDLHVRSVSPDAEWNIGRATGDEETGK